MIESGLLEGLCDFLAARGQIERLGRRLGSPSRSTRWRS